MLLARTALIGCAAVAVLASLDAARARDGANPAWTLAQDGGGRRCPVTLRFDAAGAAGGLAMPAGCRRAFPLVAGARSWAMEAHGAIRFRDAAGQNLVLFTRDADNDWRGDTGSNLTLIPPNQSASAAPASPVADPTEPGPVALVPSTPVLADASAESLDQSVIKIAAASAKAAPASIGETAGRYAVMRGDRDTGCMVTLDAGQKSSKGSPRARLAPACRDQGITIFDPLSWHMSGVQLVLTARKGHSISLDKDESGTWVKTPKDAKALGLKPL